jgi:hypothetical protein
MVSSGMLRRVALVRTDVSEELGASFIRVTRIGELGITLAVTSVVPEDTILHSHRRENLKSYIQNPSTVSPMPSISNVVTLGAGRQGFGRGASYQYNICRAENFGPCIVGLSPCRVLKLPSLYVGSLGG